MNRLFVSTIVVLFPVLVAAEDARNLLKPVNKADSWRFEEHEGAKGAPEIVDNTAVFKAQKLTGTNWHIQAFQTNLDLQEGAEYSLKLKLSAKDRRGLLLVATIDQDDWHEIGLHEELSVGKEVKSFEFTFKATNVRAKKNRVGFILGDETGDLIVKEMTLTEKTSKKP